MRKLVSLVTVHAEIPFVDSLMTKNPFPFFLSQMNRSSSYPLYLLSSSRNIHSQSQTTYSTRNSFVSLPPSSRISENLVSLSLPSAEQRRWFASKKDLEHNSPSTQKTHLTDEEIMKEAAKDLPWIGRMLVSVTSLFSSQPLIDLRSEKIYNAAEAAANSQELLDLCGFKRDFAAWFKLTILHLWIYFVRLRNAGEGSQDLQQTLLDKFWGQTEKNLVNSGVSRGMLLAKYLKQNSRFLFGFQVALDLGIRDGDTVLANTLKRNLFWDRDVTVRQLADLVAYVHRQLNYLDKQSDEAILGGEGMFAPFQ